MGYKGKVKGGDDDDDYIKEVIEQKMEELGGRAPIMGSWLMGDWAQMIFKG
jgi:hypothetical protein